MNQEKDLNFRIVSYFLRNRQLTILLLSLLVLGGVFSYFRFQVQGFPAIPVPVAVVTTIVPGAGPETIDSLVTVPLGDSLKNLKDLAQISAESRTSVSSIVLQFNQSANIANAVQEVRTKISSVSLPEQATTPEVFVPETGGAPFVVAITGQKTLLELEQDSTYFTDAIARIKGVKSVTKFGSLTKNIYVSAPLALTQTLSQQIKAASQGFPLGQVTVNNSVIPLSANAQATSIDTLKNLIVTVPTATGSEQKKLSDVATVYEAVDTNGEVNRIGFRDGNTFRIQSGALFTIRLTDDADVIKLGDTLKTELDNANSKVSNGSKAVIVFNQAVSSKQQVKEIVEGAIGGKWDINGPLKNVGYAFGATWLLVIVMLAFLDWRSAIISFISIPLSFFVTFVVLQFLGIQLNTIVLFSLILVLGLIVDPAIVVLESIKRYMEIGFTGTEAVLRSVRIIGSGIFMAVLTSFIVFVPFGLVSGTFGAIIKYIPITVIPALVASYFVPMIFLTWLAGKFLKGKTGDHAVDENDPHTLWPIARWFIRANRYILHHTWLSILVVLLGIIIPFGIAASYIGAGKIKQVQFSSPPDSEAIAVTVPLPPNITDADRIKENSALENVLKEYAPVMDSYYYQTLDGSSSNTKLGVFINLLPTAQRDQKSPEIADNVLRSLQDKFGNGAFVQQISAGPPEESYPVTVNIFENNESMLTQAMGRIAEELRSYAEISDVRYDSQTTSKDITVLLDPSKAAATGVDVGSFYGQLAANFNEQKLVRLGEEQVIIKPSTRASYTMDGLSDIEVFGSQGPVRVGDIATIMSSDVPSSIRRINGDRYGQVGGRIKNSKDIIAVQRKINAWAKDHQAELALNDRALEDRSAANDFEKSFQELFLAIGVSIVITYVVFVLFFKSFIQPFIILFAIPLLAVGVFPVLAAFAGGQIGFLEILGVIMVIGIVENVGIFLIDFANRKVAEGMDTKEAIALSSGIRFRAIILTKLTSLAGLLPLAIFAPFWRGLAIVVIMGILSSGILSLFTTPVLYHWFTRTPKGTIQPLDGTTT